MEKQKQNTCVYPQYQGVIRIPHRGNRGLSHLEEFSFEKYWLKCPSAKIILQIQERKQALKYSCLAQGCYLLQ